MFKKFIIWIYTKFYKKKEEVKIVIIEHPTPPVDFIEEMIKQRKQ